MQALIISQRRETPQVLPYSILISPSPKQQQSSGPQQEEGFLQSLLPMRKQHANCLRTQRFIHSHLGFTLILWVLLSAVGRFPKTWNGHCWAKKILNCPKCFTLFTTKLWHSHEVIGLLRGVPWWMRRMKVFTLDQHAMMKCATFISCSGLMALKFLISWLAQAWDLQFTPGVDGFLVVV